MEFRTADRNSSAVLVARVNAQRTRLSILEERIATGKRINRPSDDPAGAEIVLNLRTSQTEIQHFQRNAGVANQKLIAADDVLNGYENMLERVRTLTAQGLGDTIPQSAKNALATEIDSIRGRILSVANSKNGEEYLFGGTRQTEPPYNPTTAAPSAVPSAPQYIQIEPGANSLAVGVTAETVFADATSDIFTDLTNLAAALRGTGDAAADRATLQNTMTRLDAYKNLAGGAHAQIGANMNSAEIARDNLTASHFSLDERADSIEDADFTESALGLAETQRALDAILQVAARGQRNLFDFLG